MRNAEFLRGQAEICTALSRSTFDLTVAGRLRAMAAELRARAEEDDEQFPGELDGTARFVESH
jgi:hypothetical protein